MTKKEKKQYALPPLFWILAAIIALVIVVAISWIPIRATMWPSYISTVEKCGHKPLVVAFKSFDGSKGTYVLPGDKSYEVPGRGEYFCTEDDAKTAGYRHHE